MNSRNVDIALSVRIGDSVLSIPMLICLNQLNQKFNSNLNIKVLARPFLIKMLASLSLFNCKGMTFTEKAKSFINPPDKAFFLETTNNNLGYFSKKSFGIDNPCKKFLKFSEQTPYLVFQDIKTILPSDLVSFLVDKNRLSWYSASLFGVCLDLGYSVDQIIETFTFSLDLINLDKFIIKNSFLSEDKYVVFCMEAGYGRREQIKRYWDERNYFAIAEKCFNDFGFKSAFIGVSSEVNLPDKNYVIDLRGKLDLFKVACLLKSSNTYIGNDTGPLHVANLMKKPSVSIYFQEKLMYESNPIFPQLNNQIYMPEDIDSVYSVVNDMLRENISL